MSWGKYRKVQKFFCSIEKEIRKVDKDGNESVVPISYNIEFIDSARFMETLLLNVKIVILFLSMKVSQKI